MLSIGVYDNDHSFINKNNKNNIIFSMWFSIILEKIAKKKIVGNLLEIKQGNYVSSIMIYIGFF